MESFWSTSVMKKKKFRFGVELKVANLSNYALTKGVLFAKARLEERVNGDFEETTNKVNANNHRAQWDQSFTFSCRMFAKPQVGILEECMLRVSIRKENKVGKAEKLGYARLNLAEFSGVGPKERRCLLRAYDTNNYKGHDNSILLVTLCVTLQQGDPVYLRPESTSPSQSVEDPQLDEQSFAGSNRSSVVHSPASSSPVTPRRPPALFQNFLTRHSGLVASLRSSAGAGLGEAPQKRALEAGKEQDRADRVSIGSNDLCPEALDAENTLVAESSTATILSPSQATLSVLEETAPCPPSTTCLSLESSNTSFPPLSRVSLDSAFESNCSSTVLQRSENGDHSSLSSAANSGSLQLSLQDYAEDTSDKDEGKQSKNRFLSAEFSPSGSTSAPATVRHKKSGSLQYDSRTLDELRFHSLETSSRVSRMQRLSGAGNRTPLESVSPSIKSGGRVSNVSSSRSSLSSIKIGVESTRVDASELIDSLITKSSEDISEGQEGKAESPTGLQLYIGADGSTAVGGKSMDRPLSAAHYRKVVMDPM